MTPENTASVAAQSGEITPENAELRTEYARHLKCSLLSGHSPRTSQSRQGIPH
jgi:hypothetical protein